MSVVCGVKVGNKNEYSTCEVVWVWHRLLVVAINKNTWDEKNDFKGVIGI